MKKVLLILSATRQSQKTIDFAITTAHREGAKLIAVFVVDDQVAGTVTSKLMDIGFLGQRPSEEFQRALLDEYVQRGRQLLDDVARQAYRSGVETEIVLVRGDFAAEGRRITEEEDADLLVVTRADRPQLARVLFGSSVDDLLNSVSCPVQIVPEDEP